MATQWSAWSSIEFDGLRMQEWTMWLGPVLHKAVGFKLVDQVAYFNSETYYSGYLRANKPFFLIITPYQSNLIYTTMLDGFRTSNLVNYQFQKYFHIVDFRYDRYCHILSVLVYIFNIFNYCDVTDTHLHHFLSKLFRENMNNGVFLLNEWGVVDVN